MTSGSRTTEEFETIRFEVGEGVAHLTLDRPEKRNAMSAQMAAEIESALDGLEGVRALVITGDSRAFSAGADLSQMHTDGEPPAVRWRRLLPRLAALPVPTVGGIEGWCLGGGLELAMTLDLRIAARGARFALPEVTRGIFAGGGGTQRLPRLIGPVRAKQMLFTGEPIDGVTAEAWGLVNEVVDDGRAAARAVELATSLAAGATKAIALVKGLVDDGAAMDITAALELEAERASVLEGSQDAIEGVRAFMEKRPARFVGR